MPTPDKVPRRALQMTAPMEFGDNGPDAKSIPFAMLARSADPIDHWYWGRIVHDLAGMQHRNKIPVDYEHWGHPIGFANRFDIEPDGLRLSGALVPFKADDTTAEIIHKAAAGVPYQASIDFSRGVPTIEDVPAGRAVEVNGKQMTGPLVVVRKWELAAVAVCALGCDGATETQLSETDHELATIQRSQTTMSKDIAPEPKVIAAVEGVEGTPKAEGTAPVAPPVEATQHAAEPETATATGAKTIAIEDVRKLRDAFGDKVALDTVLTGGTFADAAVAAFKATKAELDAVKANPPAPAAAGSPAAFTPKEDGEGKSFKSLFESQKK